VSVLLAYIMLIGPFGFEQLARADIQYQDLMASDWGSDGETITYTYDDNGSIETKVVNDGRPEVTYTYQYNLRNRLAKVTDSGVGQHLLYDGHGSTRELADASAAIQESFSHDGYGVGVGIDESSATHRCFEHFSYRIGKILWQTEQTLGIIFLSVVLESNVFRPNE
jgi:hypothetical protein